MGKFTNNYMPTEDEIRRELNKSIKKNANQELATGNVSSALAAIAPHPTFNVPVIKVPCRVVCQLCAKSLEREIKWTFEDYQQGIHYKDIFNNLLQERKWHGLTQTNVICPVCVGKLIAMQDNYALRCVWLAIKEFDKNRLTQYQSV